MAFVVDASVVAAWFLPDEDGAVADDALARLETQDAFAPDLLSHELRNILLSAERRKRISADDIFAILMRFASLPVTLSSSADHVSIIRLAQNMPFPPMTLPIYRSRFRTTHLWQHRTESLRLPQSWKTSRSSKVCSKPGAI